jgi:Beta-lactamase
MTAIHGTTDPRFRAVRDAFAANFRDHGEVGAAVCVYHHGRCVVDLWGGVADATTGTPWAQDILQYVFSTTKGFTATCAHLLAQRGELDLDAPVAEYWPEFAAGGKHHLPVRWLLSHRAGLPALDTPIPLADALAWHPMTTALAAQHPLWEPGSTHGYHAHTATPRIDPNDPHVHAAEIPSSNAITTAHALAHFSSPPSPHPSDPVGDLPFKPTTATDEVTMQLDDQATVAGRAGEVPPELPLLAHFDWAALSAELDESGFALTPQLLSAEQCAEVIALFDRDDVFRSTVVMAKHAYGEGSYKYFAEPLQPLVNALRTSLYPPAGPDGEQVGSAAGRARVSP